MDPVWIWVDIIVLSSVIMVVVFSLKGGAK
jgi:hypothetical protein